MTNPINPPAFPSNISNGFDTLAAGLHQGLSMRDWFATYAMLGIVQRGGVTMDDPHWKEGDKMSVAISANAYEMADAMLQERQKEGK